MHLNVEGINPAFNANTTQYYLVVSNLINDIEVLALPEDAAARVQITGNTNLVMGNNEILVKVISQDGSASKTYKINVSKTEDKERGNASLENLAIENAMLVPEFNSDIFEYTAEVGSDVETLKILAVPQRENAEVVIEGNENLQFGDNTLTITVTAEDGITVKTYTILVHRKTQEEETKEQEMEEEQNKVEDQAKNNPDDKKNIAFSAKMDARKARNRN